MLEQNEWEDDKQTKEKQISILRPNCAEEDKIVKTQKEDEKKAKTTATRWLLLIIRNKK